MLGIMHARILARDYVARYERLRLRVLRACVYMCMYMCVYMCMYMCMYACMDALARTNDDVMATQRRRCILLIRMIGISLRRVLLSASY